MATATQEKPKVTASIAVPPWGIEIALDNSGDKMISSIPGLRMRGRIDPSRGRKKPNGETFMPTDQTMELSTLPVIPGQRLIVDPAKLTYAVIDPLEDDETLCDRIHKWLNNRNAFRTDARIRGVPRKTGTLDEDRMKTLCREMVHMVNIGHAIVVKGSLPDDAAVAALPGRFMHDPGRRVQNTQPEYEDDYLEWVARMRSAKG